MPRAAKGSIGSFIFAWAARLLVGALFLYTGITKIADHATFLKEVRQYQMIPHNATNLISIIVPWIEVIAAALLIAGLWRREARAILLGMLVVFTAAKSYGHAMGWLTGGCGCAPQGSWIYVIFEGWTGVVTNGVLILLLLGEACVTCRRRRAANDQARSTVDDPVPAGTTAE